MIKENLAPQHLIWVMIIGPQLNQQFFETPCFYLAIQYLYFIPHMYNIPGNFLIFYISQVKDGKYGSFDKTTETWNGMIGELQSQKVGQSENKTHERQRKGVGKNISIILCLI